MPLFGGGGEFNGGSGGKFNGNANSSWHNQGNNNNRDELLSRRNQADNEIKNKLKYTYGVEAEVSSFHDKNSYMVMILVPDYTSAMTVQNAFSGEQMNLSEVDGGYCITLTE